MRKRTTLARTADTNVIRLTKGTHHDRPTGSPVGPPWTGFSIWHRQYSARC
jgi:hypothetical protein